MELIGEFVELNNKPYKFNVKQVVNWKSYDGIVRTSGDHVQGKTNKDVETITFANLALGRFPKLLNCFFPNLKVVSVNSCGLKSITKDDLKGLTKLTQLILTGNRITSLPDDLFNFTPNVEVVSFYGNRIRFIGDKIFDQLKHLQYANFKLNSNIDACFKEGENGVSLHHLKKLIILNCKPVKQDIIERYFESLKAFERFQAEREQ